MADNKLATHENYQRSRGVEVGSDRSFGVVFSVVFALIGVFPLLGGRAMRVWALGIAGAIFVVAMAVPWVLHPANRLWMRFGQLLHRIVTPVILAFVFVSTVLPTALIMRLMGKDPMRRKFDPQADSYWIRRPDAEPAPETMKNQF
ncbi:MAG: hypothetical protein HN403_00955 [Rhodospirillales bacterium]|jgi:hypothetical protein|nr:hypothetical protein [Rhodospirillales bacterium]